MTQDLNRIKDSAAEALAQVAAAEDAKDSITLLENWSPETPAEYEWCVDLGKQVKAKHAHLEGLRKSITKPLLDAKGGVDDLFKPALSALLGLELCLKGKIGAYTVAQEKARVAAMQASAALYQAGGTPTAIIPDRPQAKGVTVTEVWDFEITDPALVPRGFCCPDEAKIRATLPKDLNANPGLPGVRYFKRNSVRLGK